jgi:hypothetical protein
VATVKPLRHLLWEVEPQRLDLREHRAFLIARVLRFGTPADIRWLLEAYTDAEIIETVKTSRGLDRKTATFWAVHFGIPVEEIRCLRTSWDQDY